MIIAVVFAQLECYPSLARCKTLKAKSPRREVPPGAYSIDYQEKLNTMLYDGVPVTPATSSRS